MEYVKNTSNTHSIILLAYSPDDLKMVVEVTTIV